MFSARCVIASSVEKPRNPQVPFDRVDRAKDAREQLAVRGPLLELDEFLVEARQILAAFNKKFFDQFA
jgi:hypothetical protein